MREFCWGVDPAIGHVSFAFADLACQDVEVESLIVYSDAREGQRLGMLDRQIRIYAGQVAKTFPPTCVWIEQPSGPRQNFPLTYAVGVIQAALYETLACPVWTIPSGKWKKRALGNGAATKPQIEAWARRHDADLASQDECDAFGIAWAGRLILRSGAWEAAA